MTWLFASGQYEQWVLEGGGTITTPWAKRLEANTGIFAQRRDPRNAEQAAQMPAGARLLSLSGPRDKTPEEFAKVKNEVLDKVRENNVTGAARSTEEHKSTIGAYKKVKPRVVLAKVRPQGADASASAKINPCMLPAYVKSMQSMAMPPPVKAVSMFYSPAASLRDEEAASARDEQAVIAGLQ